MPCLEIVDQSLKQKFQLDKIILGRGIEDYLTF